MRVVLAALAVLGAVAVASACQVVIVNGPGRVIAAPSSVGDDDGSFSLNMPPTQSIFAEQSGVTLAANVQLDNTMLPAGSNGLRSFMIYFNKPTGFGSGRLSSTVTYEFRGCGCIRGVASDRNGQLEAASNGAFGNPGTSYPGSFSNRGLEPSATEPLDHDNYEILGTRSLRFFSRISQPGDWIRVVLGPCANAACVDNVEGHIAVIAPLASVGNDDPSYSTGEEPHIAVMEEASGVTLPVAVQIDSPNADPAYIPAGTTDLKSLLVFLNRPPNSPSPAEASGSIRFGEECCVVGVMSDDDGLFEAASNAYFGRPGTSYPGSFNARGLESADGYAVHPDGRSINISLRVSEPGDWIRIVLGPCTVPVTCLSPRIVGAGQQIPPPESIGDSYASFIGDVPTQAIFLERQGVVTNAPVNMDGGQILPAGGPYKSFMVFLNQDDSLGDVISAEATYTFGTCCVLGTMSDGPGSLEAASNAFFANPNVNGYGAFNARGLESADSVTIVDPHTVQVSMRVSQPGDWVRIIVGECDEAIIPEPTCFLESVTGAGAIVPAPADVGDSTPSFLSRNTPVSNGFDERTDFFLARNLNADNGVVVQAGAIYSSHMIFLNQEDSQSDPVSATATYHFSCCVVAIMSDTDGLLEAASSDVAGAVGTAYPGSFAARGLESGDSATIGPDGRSVVVNMSVSQPGDWIRVITRVCGGSCPNCSERRVIGTSCQSATVSSSSSCVSVSFSDQGVCN